MPSLPARVRRVTGFLLSDPAAIALLTGVYIAAGVGFVVTDYTLNNEGLLTHYWASWARRDFVPVFFFQRVHPVLCGLYAAVSGGGPRVTLIAHVVVSATVIPMLASVARSLGYRLPNLPGLLVALSPIYFFGGAAGFSNVDGVVGIVLTLYLLCARRLPFAAGLVIGLLPWARFELATFSAVMALYALLTERRRPMLLGMAVFPLAYMCAGAVYHHDALWALHFPASVPRDPANPIYRNQLIGLRYFFEPGAALTPLAALAVALPVTRLQRIERAVLAYGVANVLAMNLLPILNIGNFGNAPRYLLHVLPALALPVGRALEPWWEGERPRLGLLLGAALLAVWLSTRQADMHATQILIAAYALILGAAWLRAGTLAVFFAAALALAGPLLPLRTEVLRSATAKYLDPMTEWLKDHPAESAQPIYTNAQLLAPFLERHLPGTSVYHLAGTDMTRELMLLSNPENGQRDRIRQLCAIDLYGKTLLPPIAPEDIPDNALFALREDVRLPLLFPTLIGSPRLAMLVETPHYRIGQFRPATEQTVDSP